MAMVSEDDMFRIGGILHEARMRECYGDGRLSSRRDWPATLKDFTRQRHAGQPWIDCAVAQVKAMYGPLQDSFDLGFKGAGGTMIPDGARDQVELSLDRIQIDALADAAEIVIDDGSLTPRQDEALARFLETISIHRSRK